MNDIPPRVRVSGPGRRTTARPRASDLEEAASLEAVYLDSLLRAQLALAARVLLVLALSVGSLPLLFLVDAVASVEVAGVPLAWVLLGGLVYPWLVLLGWRYVRRAERNERDFVELTDRRAG